MTFEACRVWEPISMKIAFSFSSFMSITLKHTVSSLVRLRVWLHVGVTVENSPVAVVQISQRRAREHDIALYISRIIVPRSTITDMRRSLIAAFKDAVGLIGDSLAVRNLREARPRTIIIHGERITFHVAFCRSRDTVVVVAVGFVMFAGLEQPALVVVFSWF